MKEVSIIVLNYNGGSEVLGCLESLFAEGKRLGWRGIRVLVVDNASVDESVSGINQLIRKNQLVSRVKVIKNKKNLGFAAGNNVGIKHALRKGADVVMLLNQDTVVQKGFLKPLLENRADITAPVIRFKRNKKWVYDYGGKINWWLGRPTHIEKAKKDMVVPEVDYVSGCAMMIKSDVFEKIGLLDEKYFLYFEDVDFCLKAKKAGIKAVVEPSSMITHKLTEGSQKPFRQRLAMVKSNLIFIHRHVPFYKKPFAYSYIKTLSIKILIVGN